MRTRLRDVTNDDLPLIEQWLHADHVLNTGGNIVGGIGALAAPLMVESLGLPVALAATAAFAMVGAGLWFLIDAEATESLGA